MTVIGFHYPVANAANCGTEPKQNPGTMLDPMNWEDMWLEGLQRGPQAGLTRKEMTMRNRLLVIGAIAGALGAPVAAQAQSDMTVGVGRGGYVVEGPVAVEGGGIALEQRPAFREYREVCRISRFRSVSSSALMPDMGVTYDVPQTFGATPYRYTVVNGQTVLVEPRSRRIVQVID